MKKSYIIASILLLFFLNNILAQEKFEFHNLQWRDGEIVINEAHLDDQVFITFETRNIPDNEVVDIEIWVKTNGELVDFVSLTQGSVRNGIVNIEWTVELPMNNVNANYVREIEENGYTIVDFAFLIRNNNLIFVSGLLEIYDWFDYEIINDTTGEPIPNSDFLILGPDGKFMPGTTNDEGRAIMRNLRRIGNYTFIM